MNIVLNLKKGTLIVDGEGKTIINGDVNISGISPKKVLVMNCHIICGGIKTTEEVQENYLMGDWDRLFNSEK
jgi:hypothetical protein